MADFIEPSATKEVILGEHDGTSIPTKKVSLYGWDSDNLKKVKLGINSNGDLNTREQNLDSDNLIQQSNHHKAWNADTSAWDKVQLNPDTGALKVDLSNANAVNVSITDSGGYYTGTEVETALQEIGASMASENLWDRTGNTIEPHTANDNLDMGSGNISTTGLVDGVDVSGLKDILDYADSPMVVTGGEITEGTTGTFTVAALTALLRKTNSPTGELTYITLDEQANQSIAAANTTYFVCLDYNDGSPQIVLSETNPYGRTASPDRTQIPIGKVMKNGSNEVHYISGGFNLQDGVMKLHQRAGYLRTHELASGNTIAYSGTNNFTMSAGVVYAGINRILQDEYDSASTQFTYVYQDGGTGWTEAASNVIDYAHYDDGDGTLGNIGVGRYGCHWVYRHVDDGHVYVVYGRGSYKLAEAEVAGEPSKPDHLTDFGCLIGKIIAPYGGGSFIVQMVTDRFFVGTSVSDHNELGSLQGGTTDEYYHLTSAQHTIATTQADTDNSGYLSDTDWDTFNGKIANLSEDASPQLGGDLDVVTHKIVSTDNRDIAIEPNGTGRVTGVYRYIEIRLLDKDTDQAADTGVGGEFRVPRAMTIKNVGAYCDSAGTDSVSTFDINEAGTSILSTKITIDATEKTSETAATPPVISDSSIAADAILTFDIDGIASGTAAKGLVIWLECVL